MNKIIVKTKEEYKVRISNAPNPEEFIYDSFVQAKKELEDIVSDTKQYYVNRKKGSSNQIDFSNNIIAFSGARGQGKSSAMLSFSNFLKNNKSDIVNDFLGDKINKNNFRVIERIDPTKFESGDNIITIILARIFQEFRKDWEVSGKDQLAMRSELLELFQLCSKEIDTIKNKNSIDSNYYGSALDRLGRIGDSANLKEDLRNLIEKYFMFQCSANNISYIEENNFLVIQLDDTDLNTKKAYDIVEDVRKYFMLPNVVVLMAVDLELLIYSIEQSYIEQFKVYDDHRKENENKFDEYHQLAIKYIDKLIPGNRKIFLPYIKPVSNEYGEQTVLQYLDVDNNENNILDFMNNSGKKIVDVQETILRFIYEKTGLIFIKPSNHRNNIVPETMRELVNFLSVLHNMDSIQNDYNDAGDLEKRLNNLSVFEIYFTKTWIPNHVNENYLPIITDFLNAPWEVKNKQIIKDIKNYFSLSMEAEEYNNIGKVIWEIENDANSKMNIFSLGDVRTVLSALENMRPDRNTDLFTFAVKTMYSIYISRLICNERLFELNKEANNIYIEIKEIDSGSSLCSFLGGDVFGKSVEGQIRKEGERKFLRSTFRVNLNKNDSSALLKKPLDGNVLPFISAFCNFEFPSSDEPIPPYDVNYRASNSAYSSNFYFNVSFPLIYLTDRSKLYSRISSTLKEISPITLTDYDFFAIRYTCVQIVSSLDLINYLDNNLKKTYQTKSNNWSFTDYISDYYKRIKKWISDIDYLPLENNWNEFLQCLSEHSQIFNEMYKKYYRDTLKVYELDELENEILNLSTYKNTNDYKELLKKTGDLLDKLMDLDRNYNQPFIVHYFLETSELEDELLASDPNMSVKDVKKYQKELNSIIKELKENFKSSR